MRKMYEILMKYNEIHEIQLPVCLEPVGLHWSLAGCSWLTSWFYLK